MGRFHCQRQIEYCVTSGHKNQALKYEDCDGFEFDDSVRLVFWK